MSMSLVLEHTALWLREKYAWLPNQCGVQYDATPPNDAGQFYVAIDDAGVEGGNDSTESLKETFTITVGIWRKPEHLSQKDRKYKLKLPVDTYLLGAYTLSDLERAVIVANPREKRSGLHKNYVFVQELNSRYELPSNELGDKFQLPLCYRGRGRMETLSVDVDGVNSQPWYGYRLRFRGLLREQVVNSNRTLG